MQAHVFEKKILEANLIHMVFKPQDKYVFENFIKMKN